LKPIITVYSTGGSEQPKKFEGYISAAFWIGVDHADQEVASVKVRQPSESYDNEVETLMEFTGLMVSQQINFAVEFFTEPPHAESEEEDLEPSQEDEPVLVTPSEVGEMDFEAELSRIKNQFKKGLVTKRQYEAKKEELLKNWKERVEGKLEG